jgi:transposase
MAKSPVHTAPLWRRRLVACCAYARSFEAQRIRNDESASVYECIYRLLPPEPWVFEIGDPAKIKAKRVRKQKTDCLDAALLLQLLLEDRFPRVWVPSPENRDLRQLLARRIEG